MLSLILKLPAAAQRIKLGISNYLTELEGVLTKAEYGHNQLLLGFDFEAFLNMTGQGGNLLEIGVPEKYVTLLANAGVTPDELLSNQLSDEELMQKVLNSKPGYSFSSVLTTKI